MADQTRTPSELGKLDFNYYNAYKIPLDEKDTNAIIRKINDLCNKRSHGSNPVEIRIFKDLKADALEVMGDPAKRAAEAANFKKMTMEPIRQFVVSLCNRGVIYKSEIQQIATKHKIDAADLEKEIKPLLSNVKYVDDTQNIFDFNVYEDIEKRLKGYKNGTYTNLFSLLEMSPTANLSEAKSKLEQGKRENAILLTKPSTEGTALKFLYGQADTVFKDDKKFKAYYKYVSIKDSVYLPLKARKDNGLTSITQDEYFDFLQATASALKESVADAELDLAAILKQCTIKLTGDADLDGKKIELCPYPDCGKPYIDDGKLKACPHCGRSFEIVCWNCKGSIVMSKNARVCPHCGVSDKVQTEFNNKVGALDLLMRNPQTTISQLKNSLTALIAVVPSYNTVASSETAKKVSFYNAEISRREKAEQANLKIFMEGIALVDKSIALKEYKKAEALLNDLQKKIPAFNAAEVDKYRRKISAEISRAVTYVSAAKRAVAANNEAASIDNALKALEICSDYEEARQIMRKVPPAAPSNIRCTIKNNKAIYVEWNAPADKKGITYNVIRKVGAKPRSCDDGTIIAKDITLDFYQDEAVTASTPYYYAVYAVRYDVMSAVSATAAGTSIFPDVYDVKQEMVEGKIKISWSCPVGTAAVKIRKAKGAAAPSENSGDEIKPDGLTGFTDTDCDGNGCSYFVCCEYNSEGAKKKSRGVQLFFKPYYIPKAPDSVTLKRAESGEYLLSGANIDGGTKLYLFAKKPVLSIKKAETAAQLSAVSQESSQISMASDGGNGFIFRIPSDKTGWLYLINMNDQLFAASEPVFVTGECGVSDLTYTEKNGTVHLAFNISPDVYQVMVKISGKGYASSSLDEGANYNYSAEQIKRNGGIDIKVVADSLSYITLFGFVGNNRENAECAPVRLPEVIDYRKKQVVKFELVYEANYSKDFTVTVKFEADEYVDLPAFILVKGGRGMLNKSMGEPIGRVEGVKLAKGLFSHGKYVAKAQVKVPPMAKTNKIAMFIDDDVKNIQMKQI